MKATDILSAAQLTHSQHDTESGLATQKRRAAVTGKLARWWAMPRLESSGLNCVRWAAATMLHLAVL